MPKAVFLFEGEFGPELKQAGDLIPNWTGFRKLMITDSELAKFFG